RRDVLHEAAELLHEHDRLVDGFVHLPVRGDERSAHVRQPSGPSLFRASTHGRLRPPRNSSDAPPPVEMCVIRSLTPALATAAIESPPPMTVVPFTAATASATSIVPFAKASISKTPIGPFQITVLACARTSR